MQFENESIALNTLAEHNGYEEVGEMTDTGDMTDAGDMPDMSEMQRLLEEQEVQFRSIKRGDVVEGQIVHIDPDEILVDIGLKSEGVLTHQGAALHRVRLAGRVAAWATMCSSTSCSLRRPRGTPVVSIKRARLERQWRIAQEQYERGELLEAEVIDFNKGGLIVNLEGIRGFVPISQILNLKREDTADNAETQNEAADRWWAASSSSRSSRSIATAIA